MADVPKDIMERAHSVYAGLHANNYDADCADWEREEDVIEIALALLSERERRTAQEVTVPAGWKLVPVEATIEMEHAAVKRVGPFHDENWYRIMPKDLFRLAWPALLAAAPSLSTISGEQTVRDVLERYPQVIASLSTSAGGGERG